MKSLRPCLTVITAVLMAPLGTAHAGWTETVLASFNSSDDGKVTGDTPLAGVIFDKKGNLYGTTNTGGKFNAGTVFKLTPPAAGKTAWTETVLFSFNGTTNGFRPHAGLIFDAKGNLYGTTEAEGGVTNGKVFKLTPPAAGKTAWTETVLYSFDETINSGAGTYSEGSLIFDANGNLYGTTVGNGASDAGTVFKLTPPAAGKTAWTKTTLFQFNEHDGGAPDAGVIFDAKGNLYGTTYFGGAYNDGTVFKLTPPAAGKSAWTETVLHSFNGATNSGPTASLILDAKGNLYGTTTTAGAEYNAGTVFKLAPPAAGKTLWTQTILLSFNTGPYGNTPYGGLVLDAKGNLYGTASAGGTGYDGTVFELSPPAAGKTTWTKTVLHVFGTINFGADGNGPEAGLIFDAKGNLYGTTEAGGADQDPGGTVFRLTP